MNKKEIKGLIDKMTLEEKLGQLLQLLPGFYIQSKEDVTGPLLELGIQEETIWSAGSVLGVTNPEDMIRIQTAYMEKSRHKIPLIFMLDVIHGFRTIFPIPLALGCTWNPELANQMAQISGREAAVSGVQVTFAPMADLVRDARWGRVMESTGEDPYLNQLFAAAMVKGYQQNGNPEYNIGACIKHIAGYGAVEGGRDYNTVDLSDWMLREYYLPSYKAAVDAGCYMAMSSFNTVHGVPSTGNSYLMKEILRKEWGFDGVVISDWCSVEELLSHGVAKDHEEAARLAMNAGIDIEMMSSNYVNHISELIASGDVTMEMVDDAVRRVLELKNKLNLFKNPFGAANTELAKTMCLSETHRKKARKIAAKSMVLLKNESVLPLKKDQKVAIIGPLAKEANILGGWRALGLAEDVVTVYDGMVAKNEKNITGYAEGCTIEGNSNRKFLEATMAAADADVIILALGEEQDMTGEATSKGNITLPGVQEKLLQRLSKLNKPIVVVLFNGRPLEISGWADKADAILEAWYPGTEGGNAVADILYGDVNPSGRLSMSFPYAVGQIPVYYNCFNTGRPKKDDKVDEPFVTKYLDIPNKPLYPFGYGLGYSTFSYGTLTVDQECLKGEDSLTVAVPVKNNGKRTGTETVQLYIRDVAGCVVRPLMELKGFQQISLEPGETRLVAFEITPDMFRYHNAKGEMVSDSGEFLVMVGPNCNEYGMIRIQYEK